ncbi:hypothetical protein JCM24511_07951 [Saitozyma sp. JCM 24511]|nr:hypothetical protein JCM24511_07951 [Saitozyma sp. JCM 24511]
MSVQSIELEQGDGLTQAALSLIVGLELGMHLSGAFGSGASGREIVNDTSASPTGEMQTSTEPDVAITPADATANTAESTEVHTEQEGEKNGYVTNSVRDEARKASEHEAASLKKLTKLDDSIKTLIAGTTSSEVDTATTESAAQTIRNRFSEIARSAGRTIAQVYLEMVNDPTNPIMLTFLSGAPERGPVAEAWANIFYTFRAIRGIVATLEQSEEGSKAMDAGLDAKKEEIVDRITQQSDSASGTADTETFLRSLKDMESGNSHFSWEEGARR